MTKGAPRVTIVDLGLGNLTSVARAVTRADGEPLISSDPEVVLRSDRVIVPGQGAFHAIASAVSTPLGDAIKESIGSGAPFLGICLGMQALFRRSEESEGDGLGLFAGDVKRFDTPRGEGGEPLKVPHMGWNQVRGSSLTEDGAWYYFVHSYVCVPEDPRDVAGTADYGGAFCAAVARDNVYACQFHPEKSHRAGEALIRRFLFRDPPFT